MLFLPINCLLCCKKKPLISTVQIVSRVCRFTLLPGMDGVVEGGQTGKLATQSVSLGDHIVGYTTNNTLMNISVIEEFANSSPAGSPDLHFFYTTPVWVWFLFCVFVFGCACVVFFLCFFFMFMFMSVSPSLVFFFVSCVCVCVCFLVCLVSCVCSLFSLPFFICWVWVLKLVGFCVCVRAFFIIFCFICWVWVNVCPYVYLCGLGEQKTNCKRPSGTNHLVMLITH